MACIVPDNRAKAYREMAPREIGIFDRAQGARHKDEIALI